MSAGTIEPLTNRDSAAHNRFSVSQYQRMVNVGVLTAEDRVELLENYVVIKLPRNPLHDGTVQRIQKRLPRYIPGGWDVRIQGSLELADSQPEPDFAVCRGDETAYLTHHPSATDVGVVVEVADTSLLRDQRDKTRIYARAGIPVYWIINLVDRRVEVYTQPTGPTAIPAYGTFQTFQPGDSVPLVLDGNTAGMVPVADLLP